MNPLIATVLLDPPTTLVFGSLLALVSGKLIRTNPQAALRKTVALAAGWSLWYGVCVGWFFFHRPDWMFVYLMDSQKLPLGLTFLAFWALLLVYGIFGALGTGLLIQQGRKAVAVLTGVGAVLSLGFLFVITANAYARVGTYAQYVKGEAPMLDADSTMKLAMNLSAVGIVLGIVAVLILQFRKARPA